MDSVDGNCMSNGAKNDYENDEYSASSNTSTVQKTMSRPNTTKIAPYYNMNHKYRGHAIIFNHETFCMGLPLRNGTHVDCNKIRDTLKSLGFDVKISHDNDIQEIKATVYDVSKSDFSDCDCFVMIVLSHGDRGILYARNAPYKPDLLWNSFADDRCPSLAGKPKLFFIQACQGDKVDGGVTLMSRTETDGHMSESIRILTQPDFLVAVSTVPGYYSWRNPTKGSWFIQTLCDELEQNAFKYDLLTLLTFVNQRVAIDYESNIPDKPHMHEQKQIPCITSMLTRLLQFTKKG